ncbi:MAG: hypothetical protein WBB28_01585 [Crinalium sp.]
MALTYLDSAIARQKLIATGEFSENDAPSIEIIEEVLANIACYLEEWLNYCPLPTTHTDIFPAGRGKDVLLHEYPVIEITSVSVKMPQVIGYTNLAAGVQYNAYSLWGEQRRITVFCHHAGSIKVEYIAGYESLPNVFALTVFQVLRQALKQKTFAGDLSFLNEPYRDVTSISIPGISKGFSTGKPAKPTGDGLVKDRLFQPLSGYIRRYTT